MATLKDIAGRAQVSQATVSRVLNQDPNLSITQAKRELIWQIAKELNYKTVSQRVQAQSGQAQGGAQSPFFAVEDGKSRRIGIAQMLELKELAQDIYYIALKQMVDQACFAHGWTTVLFFRNEEGHFVKHDEEPIDGMIAIGSFTDVEIADFEQQTSNIVFLDSSPDPLKYYSIVPFYHLAVREVFRHCHEKGKTRIGYVGSKYTYDDNKKLAQDPRYYYYKVSMINNHCFNRDLVIECQNEAQQGYEAMTAYLQTHKEKALPEVLFAASDAVAPGVVKALHDAGLSIPEDIGLVTFNNTSFSEFSSPPLTSIEVFMDEIAKMAVQCMIFGWENQGRIAKRMEVPCKLIDRGSVL